MACRVNGLRLTANSFHDISALRPSSRWAGKVRPSRGDRGSRLCVTFRRVGAVRFPSNRAARVALRRDKSFLDVALPRLEILHAPLGLLTGQTHLVGHVVDALSAVELLIVRDAGSRDVDLVSALPLFLDILGRLLAA